MDQIAGALIVVVYVWVWICIRRTGRERRQVRDWAAATDHEELVDAVPWDHHFLYNLTLRNPIDLYRRR